MKYVLVRESNEWGTGYVSNIHTGIDIDDGKLRTRTGALSITNDLQKAMIFNYREGLYWIQAPNIEIGHIDPRDIKDSEIYKWYYVPIKIKELR